MRPLCCCPLALNCLMIPCSQGKLQGTELEEYLDFEGHRWCVLPPVYHCCLPPDLLLSATPWHLQFIHPRFMHPGLPTFPIQLGGEVVQQQVPKDTLTLRRDGEQLVGTVCRVVKKMPCPEGQPPPNWGTPKCKKLQGGTGCYAAPFSPCWHFACDGTTVCPLAAACLLCVLLPSCLGFGTPSPTTGAADDAFQAALWEADD